MDPVSPSNAINKAEIHLSKDRMNRLTYRAIQVLKDYDHLKPPHNNSINEFN